MKHIALIYTALLFVTTTGCHEIEQQPDDPHGNFTSLWETVDNHYCFFEEKGIDWDSIRTVYEPVVRQTMKSRELFTVCAQMLGELHDGHTNLSSPFATSYYRNWWSDYPQNFDGRLIEQYYFNFNYTQLGATYYGILSSNVGYLRVPTFTSGLGDGNIDWILNYLSSCAGLIIDVRDNGGGNLTNAERLASHFFPTETVVGYLVHKTGPGHNDFSEPFEVKSQPSPTGSLIWGKPVVVLTNRSTFSAANFFVAVMKTLPQVRITGATTGGGAGMPWSSELPNGWGVRMSAVKMLDAQGNATETGISPTPGCEVALDPVQAARGIDSMIEFAVRLIAEQ